MFSNWLRRLVNRKPQPLTGGRRSAKRTARPRLEYLEDRLAPATLVWQGDVNNRWNGGTVAVDTNWADQATLAQVKPQDGDDLLFPLVALNQTNTNDIAGLDLGSITFGGIAYVVGGNAVSL